MMVTKENTTPLGTRLPVSDPRPVNYERTRARYISGASKIRQPTGPRILRIGSWNVGSMNGRSYQLEDVMKRRRLDVLCVQETKWRNLGNKTRFLDTRTKQFKIYYHGLENCRNGVGIILSLEFQNSIVSIEKVSDRLMSIKLIVGREIWNIVSAYAPQTGCTAAEKETFWIELENLLKRIPKDEKVFIGADLNGHVGTQNRGDKRWHGGRGYGARNEQGHEIVRFAKAHGMAILNTFFKKHPRHLVTYSSGGRESQIDYHLCTDEVRKLVRDCKVILGEDVVDQHRLLLTEIRFPAFSRKKDTSIKIEKIRWQRLQSDEGQQFMMEIRDWLTDIIEAENELDANEMWQAFQDVCRKSKSPTWCVKRPTPRPKRDLVLERRLDQDGSSSEESSICGVVKM